MDWETDDHMPQPTCYPSKASLCMQQGATFLKLHSYELALGSFNTAIGLGRPPLSTVHNKNYDTILIKYNNNNNNNLNNNNLNNNHKSPGQYNVENKTTDFSLYISPIVYLLRAAAFLGYDRSSSPSPSSHPSGGSKYSAAAIQDIHRYLAVVPSSREGYLMLGEALRRRGQYQEAVTAYRSASSTPMGNTDENNGHEDKDKDKEDVFATLYHALTAPDRHIRHSMETTLVTEYEGLLMHLLADMGAEDHHDNNNGKDNNNDHDGEASGMKPVPLSIAEMVCVAGSIDRAARSMGAAMLDYIGDDAESGPGDGYDGSGDGNDEDESHTRRGGGVTSDARGRRNDGEDRNHPYFPGSQLEQAVDSGAIEVLVDSMRLATHNDDLELQFFSTQALSSLCGAGDIGVRWRMVHAGAVKALVSWLQLSVHRRRQHCGHGGEDEVCSVTLAALANVGRGGTGIDEAVRETGGLHAVLDLLPSYGPSCSPGTLKFAVQALMALTGDVGNKIAVVAYAGAVPALLRLAQGRNGHPTTRVRTRPYAVAALGNVCQNPGVWGRGYLYPQVRRCVDDLVKDGVVEMLLSWMGTEDGSDEKGNHTSNNMDQEQIDEELSYNSLVTMTNLIGFQCVRQRLRHINGIPVLHAMRCSPYIGIADAATKALRFFCTLEEHGDQCCGSGSGGSRGSRDGAAGHGARVQAQGMRSTTCAAPRHQDVVPIGEQTIAQGNLRRRLTARARNVGWV